MSCRRLGELVAGILEAGETPESAVRRELLEEIGYETEKLERIATFYVSPGGSSERILLYFAEVSEKGKLGDGGGLRVEEEDIATVAISLEEINRMLLMGEIQDAKTIIGIQWLQARIHLAELQEQK